MNRKTASLLVVSTLVFFAFAFSGFVVPDKPTFAQSTTDQALNRSARRLQRQQKYRLQYKLKKGEKLRWQVEQIANTDASIAGYDEESSMKTRSVIAWEILSVDETGKMTIQDVLESAVEWQKTGDKDPVSYDSTKDQQVPDEYVSTAEKIGKIIATTTIRPSGAVVQKESHIPTAGLGMGRFTLQFPETPIAIGDQWNRPEVLKARRADQTLKEIKTRVLYTLRSVENGIATISFRREILTPIKEASIKSQLQQKMNQGTLHFDIARGRITRKFVQWDEKVLGWHGKDSYLHYVARYSMKLIEDNLTESSNTATNKSGSDSLQKPNKLANPLKPKTSEPGSRTGNYIRPRGGKPIIRK